MAKLNTIEIDDTGTARVVRTDHLPQPPPPPRPKSPQRRIPSSPHKPFTSHNFYDLTKSNSATPEIIKSAVTIDLTESPPVNPRILKPMHRNVDHRNVKTGQTLIFLLIQALISLIPPRFFLQNQPCGHQK